MRNSRFTARRRSYLHGTLYVILLTARAKGTKSTFFNQIPCLPVANMEESLAFYSTVLSFTRVGPKNESRTLLFRGAPGAGASAAHQNAPGARLIVRATNREVVPQELQICVSNLDSVFADGAQRLLNETQTRSEYFPHTYLRSACVLHRPQVTPWRTRECAFCDPDGHVLVFVES